MSRFVLVHGSFHAGWCWEEVVPRLEAAGHHAVAIDLPGRGRSAAIAPSLASYADTIAAAIDASPEPVVLVGHSMGGVPVTQAAELRPDRIRRLVYLAAFLPRDGESLLSLAKNDTESIIFPNMVMEGGVHFVRPEAVRDVFFHDCSDKDQSRAAARLLPEPLGPIETPVRTTAARSGSVPRLYIQTTADRALGPSLQREMCRAQPCDVRTLPTSHSPFYSAPDALTEILAAI